MSNLRKRKNGERKCKKNSDLTYSVRFYDIKKLF